MTLYHGSPIGDLTELKPFLSIAKAMVYHHAARVYIIKGGIAALVSHHTFRCVSKTIFAMMIFNG